MYNKGSFMLIRGRLQLAQCDVFPWTDGMWWPRIQTACAQSHKMV